MKVRLIHWNAEESRDRARSLARAGHEVIASPFTPQEVRKIKTHPPEVILIDLSRLPSQGRDAALLIRQTKSTRLTPLVFVEGDPERVAAIQKILPDYSGFERQLGALPSRVILRRNPRGRRDLTLWFVRSRGDLERGMAMMKEHARSAGLWIVWPKRTSTAAADISQVAVRKVGLAAGIVDFKIASIDTGWSGLRFTQRKPPQ